jgi:hypothetical protein
MIVPTNTTPITITPNAVRYSLQVDRLSGAYRGTICLHRAHRTDNGASQTTWIDDPRPSAHATLDVASLSGAVHTAITNIIDLLPTVLGRAIVGLTLSSVGDARARLTGALNASGILDVSITLQVRVGGSWIAHALPSLNTFLAANPDLAASIVSAWTALDAALDAENAQQEWM